MYIWFTISLEYPNAYSYSFCPGKILNLGLSGGNSGYVNPILSNCYPFSDIFCLFLQFSTLDWNQVIFGLQLVWSILVHMLTVVSRGKH